MLKILAVTGIRSEVEYLLPILLEFTKTEHEVQVAICGSHLSSNHEESYKEIIKNGFRIADRIDSLIDTDRLVQRTKGIGLLVNGLSQTIEREKPDVILVVGDREESIAASIVGNYMNVLVAHVGGGDLVYGNSDDPIRHAVSSLAHIHFVLCEKYRENLLLMGEESFRVFNVGSPSVDRIKSERAIDLVTISNKLDFRLEMSNYIMLINHPLSSEYNKAKSQMEVLLSAVEAYCREKNIKCVAIHPNTDPGSKEITSVIEEYSQSEYIKFFKNIDRPEFISLLRNAKSLIGNSSLGILEAPYLRLPVVNVGNRQKGRITARNVKFVDYNYAEIFSALDEVIDNEVFRKEILVDYYGEGNASKRIVEVLSGVDAQNNKWLVKMKEW